LYVKQTHWFATQIRFIRHNVWQYNINVLWQPQFIKWLLKVKKKHKNSKNAENGTLDKRS